MIVTISGLAGSGKDTFANLLFPYLKEKGFTKTSFAAPLYLGADVVFGAGCEARDRKEKPTLLSKGAFLRGVPAAVEAVIAGRHYEWPTSTVSCVKRDLMLHFTDYAVREHNTYTPRSWMYAVSSAIKHVLGEYALTNRVRDLPNEHTLVTDCRWGHEARISNLRLFVYRPNLGTFNTGGIATEAEQLNDRISYYIDSCIKQSGIFPNMVYLNGHWYHVIYNDADLDHLADEALFVNKLIQERI